MYLQRGFFTVITPDRMLDLRRFLTTLRRHNNEPVQIFVVDNPFECFRCKTLAPKLSHFDLTVSIDTDIYVNGSLKYLFDLAGRGKIGIYHEKTVDVFNAGVIAYPKNIGLKLSAEWYKLFQDRVKNCNTKKDVCDYQYTDQPPLNEIIRKYPIEVIPEFYNYILKEHTPEEETRDFSKVKAFHFLHGGIDYSTKSPYKSWRMWVFLNQSL